MAGADDPEKYPLGRCQAIRSDERRCRHAALGAPFLVVEEGVPLGRAVWLCLGCAPRARGDLPPLEPAHAAEWEPFPVTVDMLPPLEELDTSAAALRKSADGSYGGVVWRARPDPMAGLLGAWEGVV